MGKFTMRNSRMRNKLWKIVGSLWKLEGSLCKLYLGPLERLWTRRRPELFIAAVGTVAVSFTIVAKSIKHDPQLPRDRVPASQATSAHEKKLRILKTRSNHEDTHHESEGGREANKGGGNLQITIGLKSREVEGEGEVLHLVASIQALADMDSLEFAWLLPADLTVIAGQREGSFGRLSLGDEKKLEVTIATHSTVNRQLDLHVYRMVNGEAHGQIAQFNTTDKDKLAQEAKKMFSPIKDKGDSEGTTAGERSLRVQQ